MKYTHVKNISSGFAVGALALSFSVTALAATDDWEVVVYKEGSNMLQLKAHPATKIHLMADPNGAKILSVKPHETHKDIEVIEYDAGVQGTSEMVHVKHAILFDTKTRKILGDFPVSEEVMNAPKGKQPAQPKWTADASSIRVFDPSSASTSIINVKTDEVSEAPAAPAAPAKARR